MRDLDLNQIRSEYLKFFESKNHMVLKSFPLVPQDKSDKSLLLINAGMAPLKKYFTGEKKMKKNRATSSQRCIRTGDIEEVGKTQRHGTFFEMLGNFSFGDYFKNEAIAWAWEFLTEVLEIPEDILWVSVYEEDDEAFEIWNKKIGVPAEKIVKLGKEDNFWELEQGPCGPCSEIYIDRGDKYACDNPDCKPGCECDRFMEVWNLVFTQFNKDAEGNYNRLEHPNIDTGMGLERIALILEGADNIFEIGLLKDIIHKIEELSNKKYNVDEKVDQSIRIITDHSRAMTFLIYDGVIPSNEGRGYVLRRLIRRAARHGKLLGINNHFLTDISKVVMEAYKSEYPELLEEQDRILKIIDAEECKFQETIEQGLNILQKMIDEAKENNKNTISGEDSFKLYDTYGFPIDLTLEILEEQGFTTSIDDFNENMKQQKLRSKNARNIDEIGWSGNDNSIIKNLSETKFLGYDKLNTEATIENIFLNDDEEKVISSGEKGIIVLSESTFYGESGGQVGDKGIIESKNGKAIVLDTQKNKNNAILHYVEMVEGTLSVDEKVEAKVNLQNRRDTMKNHTATHLLHKALKSVIGDHVNQAGSYVDSKRLRFDITHFEAISKDDLSKIEKIVNEKISLGLPVNSKEMSYKESEELGAIGLFEDKYKDKVRVVSIGDKYSQELCGGTHVQTTSDIQMFKIISESSVAAGVRRIEAITGREVYNYINNKDLLLTEISSTLKSKQSDIINRIEFILAENKNLEKEIKNIKSNDVKKDLENIINSAKTIDDFKVVTHNYNGLDMNTLREIADTIKNKISSGVVVLSNITDDNKVNFVAAVSKDVIDKNIFAGNVVREVAKLTGGNGGGRKDFAAAGGKDATKVPTALESVYQIVESMLK